MFVCRDGGTFLRYNLAAMADADVLSYETPPQDPSPAPKGALLIIFLIVFMDLLGFGVIIPLLPFYATRYQASAVGLRSR